MKVRKAYCFHSVMQSFELHHNANEDVVVGKSITAQIAYLQILFETKKANSPHHFIGTRNFTATSFLLFSILHCSIFIISLREAVGVLSHSQSRHLMGSPEEM